MRSGRSRKPCPVPILPGGVSHGSRLRNGGEGDRTATRFVLSLVNVQNWILLYALGGYRDNLPEDRPSEWVVDTTRGTDRVGGNSMWTEGFSHPSGGRLTLAGRGGAPAIRATLCRGGRLSGWVDRVGVAVCPLAWRWPDCSSWCWRGAVRLVVAFVSGRAGRLEVVRSVRTGGRRCLLMRGRRFRVRWV
jgi:hypothetical protein